MRSPQCVVFTNNYYDDKIKNDKMDGTIITHGKDEKHKILVVNPEGKRPRGSPRLREIRWRM